MGYNYILFAGSEYYASGPIGDFVSGFETVEEANKYVEDNKDFLTGEKETYDLEKGHELTYSGDYGVIDWYTLMKVSNWTCIDDGGRIHGAS